jgi:hypothetical protein
MGFFNNPGRWFEKKICGVEDRSKSKWVDKDGEDDFWPKFSDGKSINIHQNSAGSTKVTFTSTGAKISGKYDL